jgi:hypothetical protein
MRTVSAVVAAEYLLAMIASLEMVDRHGRVQGLCRGSGARRKLAARLRGAVDDA